MNRRGAIAAVLCAAALLVAGCTGTSRGGNGATRIESAEAPITNTDPCAMRLHDLSGALLAYYAIYYEFPQDLSELTAESMVVQPPPLECPVSGIPYIYDAAGILLPERGSRIIVYDPAPSHSRMRWAITVEEPAYGGLPITKVVALPESFFLLRPPQ